MKFLRLTSTDPDAIFNADFNDGIHIPPNSQIALQSASANVSGGAIEIKDANNSVTYQIKDGFEKSFQLTNNDYNKGNVGTLLTDIQHQFNRDSSYETGLEKVLGLGWECVNDNTGRVDIGYRIGQANGYGDPTSLRYTWTANNVKLDNIGTAEQDYEVALMPAVPAGQNFDNALVNKHPVARGCGYLRATIKTLADSGVDNNNGFYMGLTLEPADADDFEERMMDYGIRATIVGGVPKFFKVFDGVASPIVGAFSPNVGDVLEVVKDGSGVKLHQYLAGQSTPNILGTFALSSTKFEYYPFFCMSATKTHASVNEMNWTPDMWSNVWDASQYLTSPKIKIARSNTAVPTNHYPVPYSNNFIRFSNTVASFLGFDFPRNPPFGFDNAREPLFSGDQIFSIGLSLNSYIIQLLNIKIDSYDSLKKQRENILAVIPDGNSMGDIDYSPPELFFIDLLNKEPLTIRNIKARITNSDYSELEMEGLGILNLLIKTP